MRDGLLMAAYGMMRGMKAKTIVNLVAWMASLTANLA